MSWRSPSRPAALSEPTRRALDGVAGGPVVRAVMPHPIDLELFRPDPSAVVPGRVGFAGRFDDPRKNLELFLDAIALARRGTPSLTAEVIGRAPESGHLEAVARRGLEGVLTFAGELDSAEYAERLRTLDFFCLTSHQEGLGIAALEAMASGCPVVATRCGGPEEFVRDDASGFLTDFSVSAIAARLAELSGDRHLRGRLGQGSRALVEERYSWPRVRDIFSRELEGFRSTFDVRTSS